MGESESASEQSRNDAGNQVAENTSKRTEQFKAATVAEKCLLRRVYYNYLVITARVSCKDLTAKIARLLYGLAVVAA